MSPSSQEELATTKRHLDHFRPVRFFGQGSNREHPGTYMSTCHHYRW